MKKPILKKEYTRTDLVIFGNYLLSKQREKSIKAGAHYQVDKKAVRNVHHADIENAFDSEKFNASALTSNPNKKNRNYLLTQLGETQNQFATNFYKKRECKDESELAKLKVQEMQLKERIEDIKELLKQT